MRWHAYPVLAGELGDGIDLGPGGTFSSILLPGEYEVKASVVDSGGLTGSDSVTLIIEGHGLPCEAALGTPVEIRRRCRDDG